MGSFSVAVRNGWLTASIGGAPYANSQVWVQLHIGSPGAAGTTNTAANTQRQQVTFGTVAAGAVSNSVAVTWTGVAATETYTDVSLWSLAVGGTFLGSDQLAAPSPVVGGGSFTISIGGIALAVG